MITINNYKKKQFLRDQIQEKLLSMAKQESDCARVRLHLTHQYRTEVFFRFFVFDRSFKIHLFIRRRLLIICRFYWFNLVRVQKST